MDATIFREPRRRTIAIDSATGPGEISALDFGPEDRPIDVIFVHANGFNAQTYRSILGPLSAGLRILAPDQRGHGQTTLPADPRGRRSWDDLRDDLVGLIDALGAPPLVLAGHSMGGTASLLATARRAQAVKALALFDPVLLPRVVGLQSRWLGTGAMLRHNPMVAGALKRRAVFADRATALAAYRGRGAFRTWPEVMIADYVAGGFKDRPDGQVELACAPEWEASNYAAQGSNPWAALRKVEQPSAILKADKASTCQLAIDAGFGRGRRNVTVTTVPGTTHFLPMERPDLVSEALMDAVGKAG